MNLNNFPKRQFVHGIDYEIPDPFDYVYMDVAWGKIGTYIVIHARLGANGGGGRVTVLFQEGKCYYSPLSIWPSRKNGIVELPPDLAMPWEKLAQRALFFLPTIKSVEEYGFISGVDHFLHEPTGIRIDSPIALPISVGTTNKFYNLQDYMLPGKDEYDVIRIQNGYFITFADGSYRLIRPNDDMTGLNELQRVLFYPREYTRQGDCFVYKQETLPEEFPEWEPENIFRTLDRHEIVPSLGTEIRKRNGVYFVSGEFTLHHPEHEELMFSPGQYYVTLLPGKSSMYTEGAD